MEEKNFDIPKNTRFEKLLEENLEHNKQILASVNATRRYIMIMQIMNAIGLLIVIIPLILGAIYLPPILSKVIDMYTEVLDVSPSSIFDEFKDVL